MGGLYCLPTSVDLPTTPEGTPPIFTAGPPESPSTLTQDNLEGGRLATNSDDAPNALEAVALFHSPSAAQEDEGRPGNTTDHNVVDEARTSDGDDAIIGNQATGASDHGNNDAPPNLTQFETADGTQNETADGGNDGGGGDPGTNAQGEGGTVRVRDFEGEEDLARQVLHPCDNQLIGVYGDSIHRNDGRHLDGGIADDKVWQGRYDRVVSHPHPM